MPKWGSSPLTRGKHNQVTNDTNNQGLIPAHAGKTFGVTLVEDCIWAHPRSRGENAETACFHCDSEGSSPLTRGKQQQQRTNTNKHGLIPAHAGKTGPGLGGPSADSGSSPLTRGKPRILIFLSVLLRLIPAHAGKTVLLVSAANRHGAHPRSRGENG